jgi:hypothetical protein
MFIEFSSMMLTALESKRVFTCLSFSFTFAARNERHEAREARDCSRRRDFHEQNFTAGLLHRYRVQCSEIDLLLFFPRSSSSTPSKITHARINSPRVLRRYVANLFHARSSLPKINPLAITSRAQAKRYKPLCARTWARVTSHFVSKTDGIASAGRLFKRIASPDIASNIFNALLNNPQTSPYRRLWFACNCLPLFNCYCRFHFHG